MNKKERGFVKTVRDFYTSSGRTHLPWRITTDPYHILVSEIMLQQTQVERVLPKYHAFLSALPSIESLGSARLSEVLILWQGLGYNRRAKMLHECAKMILADHEGVVPQEYDALIALPGIGPYTAGAIRAFSFNMPTPLIETNIRTAYLHHFFEGRKEVDDEEILQYIEKTLDKKNPREWYAALMDYGSHLKEMYGNQNTRSKHYKKQSTFEGSDRQIRGAILRLLTEGGSTKMKVYSRLPFEKTRINEKLSELMVEGLVELTRKKYSLPG